MFTVCGTVWYPKKTLKTRWTMMNDWFLLFKNGQMEQQNRTLITDHDFRLRVCQLKSAKTQMGFRLLKMLQTKE